MAGKTPEHAFTGYLEVDGIPIGPNMSLKEIQARRKRLGLEPLYQDSGPQYYVAPRAKTGSEWESNVGFDVTVGDGGVILISAESHFIPLTSSLQCRSVRQSKMPRLFTVALRTKNTAYLSAELLVT